RKAFSPARAVPGAAPAPVGASPGMLTSAADKKRSRNRKQPKPAAESVPALAPAPTQKPPQTDVDALKRIRQLKKKLAQIDSLAARRDAGEALEVNQLAKIGSRPQIDAEIADLSAKMRSAPNSKRNAPVNGTSAASDGGTAAPGEKPTDLLSDTNALLLTANDADAPVYSHEKMLELFKVQSVADDFIINDCVFSQKALPPVCMTELSAKEQELLAGPVNSTSSRRYNGGQHAPAHQHPRSNNASQRPNGHGSFSGTRARLRDADRSAAYQNFDTGTNGDYAGGIGMLSDALDTDREADSLWADQMIGRESIGSFGADGVFRMSGVGDDTGLLERPPPHSSIKGDIGPSAYSSRAASPSAAGSRAAALKSPQSHQHPGSSGDSYAWNELASMPISPAQQRLLADRAERLKWWYRDPQGNTQGPFSTAHMQEWCSGGYFPSNLQVCHEGGPGFESLNAMIDRI
ncbi:kinesin-like protein, partial [Coemansia brasiliensis]